TDADNGTRPHLPPPRPAAHLPANRRPVPRLAIVRPRLPGPDRELGAFRQLESPGPRVFDRVNPAARRPPGAIEADRPGATVPAPPECKEWSPGRTGPFSIRRFPTCDEP